MTSGKARDEKTQASRVAYHWNFLVTTVHANAAVLFSNATTFAKK